MFDRGQGCTNFCWSKGQPIDLIIMNLLLSLWVNHTVHVAVILGGDAVTTASVILYVWYDSYEFEYITLTLLRCSMVTELTQKMTPGQFTML